MTRSSCGVLLCVFLSGLVGRVGAASLKVAPARFILHDVKPGKLYDIYAATGLRITIYNDDDTTRTWLLSTHRPSERGKWEKGYGEIPDPRWCWFEKNEITVGHNCSLASRTFLNIDYRW